LSSRPMPSMLPRILLFPQREFAGGCRRGLLPNAKDPIFADILF